MGKNGKATADRPLPPMRRFTLPPGCSVREIILREISARDEDEASSMADTMGRADDSPAKAARADALERMRIALVMVDGKRVNADGAVPFMGMNGWNAKTLRHLEAAFVEMNGVTPEDLERFRKGSEPVSLADLSLPGSDSEAFTVPAGPG